MGGLFGGVKAAPAPPTMPLPDDQAAMDAKRRAILGMQQQSGRDSTFLSRAQNGVPLTDKTGGGGA